jgi:hypothetical protein
MPGRRVSAGILMLNYGATSVTATQKNQPLFSLKRRPHFQTHKRFWNEQNFGHWSRPGPKSRMTVLARLRSNLLVLDLNGWWGINWFNTLARRFQKVVTEGRSRNMWSTVPAVPWIKGSNMYLVNFIGAVVVVQRLYFIDFCKYLLWMGWWKIASTP